MPDTTVYYFTGTGNSLYAARMLAERLGDCDIVPIVKTLNSGAKIDGGRIIVVFPVYMYRAPHIVCRFFKRIQSASQIIVVATMGGEAGRTFSQLRSILRKNGQDLYAGYEIIMPDSYIPFEGAMPDDEQRKSLEEARAKIDAIAKQIIGGQWAIEEHTPFFKVRIWPGIWFWYAYIIIPKLGRYFRVEQSCNGCGICSQVCPSGAVIVENGKPRWTDGCEQCLACLHWCPKEAIQYGGKTKDRRRYRNLFVTMNDIVAQKEET